MKNIFKTLILLLIFTVVYFAVSSFKSNDGYTVKNDVSFNKHLNKSAQLIEQRKKETAFPQFELFNFQNGSNASAKIFASDAVMLKIDKNLLNSFNKIRPNDMTFKIPVSDNSFIELELTKVNIFAENFKLFKITSSGKVQQNYTGGLYYAGIIKGNENSLATFSVFQNRVMAIVSTDKGNYILGNVKNGNDKITDNYVFYNDRNMVTKPQFECKSGDAYDRFYRDSKKIIRSNNSSLTTSPVNMNYICDYQMYLDNGSNITSTGDFVTGAFVHIKHLYANESIPLNISEIDVYDAPDPYLTYSTSQTEEILKDFGTHTGDTFNGDLAQLLSSRTPVMGGIAWINVLCQSYEPTSQSGRYSFCQIENTYNPYPTFSWTIEVMTHEAGHNFGSNHTHACAWPVIPGGGLGAIDSCVQAEGSCFTFTQPNNNGTIMSYCHLNGNINFMSGFGPLPHDTITYRYSQALCLDSNNFSSEIPVTFNLMQNYPNPFNPGTYIKYALPEDGYITLKIFDISGREVTELVKNRFYQAGVFSIYFDASAYNLASGVYFYRIDANNGSINTFSEIKKMVLVK
jgi:hypothetical protein